MNDNARRYILDVCDVISCGVGVSGTTQSYNLLNNFSVTTGSTTCSFPNLTIDNLKSLSVPDYEKRVSFFLEYVNLQENTLKTTLKESASFYDSDCEIRCNLNSNFLVYKFFSGVRVVNVGEANGTLEYIVYPKGDDISGYTWQENGTFLGLDPSGIYIVKIRDYFEGEVVCEYEKEVNLSFLEYSTTATIGNVLIGLNEISRNLTYGVCYAYGNLISTPSLVSGQRVRLDYVASTYAFGGGNSCVVVSCKGPLDTSFQKYCCITESDSTPQTVQLELDSETQWCYNLVGQSQVCGAFSQAELTLSSVNGLGTVNPTIDVGACSTSVSNSAPSVNVTASTEVISSSSPVDGVCYKNGCIKFNNPIPQGNCVTLNMSAATQVFNGGTACVSFYCTPNGSTSPPVLLNKTYGGDTCTPSIVARYGDVICYNILVDAQDAGACGVSEFCINNMSGSYGVNTYISETNKSDCVVDCTAPPNTQISLCNQSDVSASTSCSKNGFINSSYTLTGTQTVTVGVCGVAYVDGNAISCVRIACKPAGSTGFVSIVGFNPIPFGQPNCTGSFTMRAGDTICYELYSVQYDPSGVGVASLVLCSASGSGVNASVNTSKCSENVNKP